ncbi:hypothetical protein J4E86_006753 [Alternaria arbusti]|uniref:uncharacterized protein n=1 Tax=Alternaria arbusti TaxID=232088 RepID=UPI00221F74E2|nr:uncharacterized protein J4E86_006753 [Alternaria arbusti]KAI4953212.1 hypothetical protein J4E86_006753 [Alternaria arbusti]
MSGLNEPQTFLAKYTLYKRATEYIAGWIAETAASIGFEVKTKEQKQTKSRSKSKKGAGRKGNQNAKGGGGGTVYQLGVSDFVPMAEAIAKAGEEAESEIMVPVALCRHFSRAIQTRRKVSQWYKAKVNPDTNSDLRHEYFIKVLEDTFASLKPFLGSGGPEIARNNGSATNVADLSSRNRFAGLTVDELVALADEEDIAEDTLPDVSNVTLEEAEEDKEDDFWIAVALMLQEQQDMREVVRDNWQKYKSGKVDLIVAAMTTDTAIKLAQSAEAKFDLLVTRPKKYPVTEYPVWTLPAVLFYNNHEDMHKWSLAEIAKPSTRLGVTADAQSEAHFDFWPVFAGLKFYLHKHMTKKNSIPQQSNIQSNRTFRAIEHAQIMRIVAKAAKRPPLLDMVSKGLLDMFTEHKIPMWLTYGVQLHFDSQDIMGEMTNRPHFELQVYLNHLMGVEQAITNNWEHPMMPDNIQDECYKPFREAYNDISSWANHDGFAEQWQQLAQDPKVNGHPIFGMMKKKAFYIYKHHPLLNGMLKYHFLVHWHAAGLSHEATSCSLLFMAHVYMGTQLRSPSDPVWPDMEFMLFSQDPRYVLIKRPPESPEEARTLFDLATGQPTLKQVQSYTFDRLDLSRGDLGRPRYDPTNKSRLFRDATVFGETVYLPRGASGCWIKKIPGGAFNGRIDTITTALLEASAPDATRGRLARAMQASQEQQGLKLEPINGRDGLTSVAILEHFAFWLQADLPDLYFNGTLMQRQCSDTWKAIYAALENDPAWDPSFSETGRSPQHAANTIITTSLIEGKYPRFMDIARRVMRNHLRQQEENYESAQSEVCLKDLTKYHKGAARLFTDDGPLNVDNLYKGWSQEHRQQRKHNFAAAAAQAEVTAGNAELQEMFQARAMQAMSSMITGGAADQCMVM